MIWTIIIGFITIAAVGIWALNDAINEMEVWQNGGDFK